MLDGIDKVGLDPQQATRGQVPTGNRQMNLPIGYPFLVCLIVPFVNDLVQCQVENSDERT
jgi:hypothetical protein